MTIVQEARSLVDRAWVDRPLISHPMPKINNFLQKNRTTGKNTRTKDDLT
ncbi:MAG: hypothetical protein ACRC62_19290 [Microcoleus sp.]